MSYLNTVFYLRKFIWIFVFLFISYSCKKDFDRQAAVITKSVDLPTANAKATVIDLGRGTITDHGFCWDSINNPTFEKSRLTLGGLAYTGDYQGLLTGLLPKKTYYLRAFVAFGENLEYGDQITFTTPDLPSLTTKIITDITDEGAKSGGNITSDGGAPVIARGVCWSTNNNPDLSNNHTLDSAGTGNFASQLFGLNAGNLYYVRAYASNIYGTRYGNELSFTSGQGQTAPVVTSKEVTSITQTSATCGGNVVSDGGSPVTTRGVCWSTSPYPTTDNSKTSDGSGTGEFTSSLTGLTANTTYYLRAYATNEKGTSYGDEKSFQTLSNPNLPTVTTATVTNITQTTATSGGNVLTDGGSAVTARGVCWGTASNPTISNSHTTNGSGLGTFTSSVTGLTASTKYYIRAYATNNVGTAYGNEVTITTLANPVLPTVTTTTATNITQTSATSGGNVTSDGGSTVTARGVCWNTSTNPTISNSHTNDGSGLGIFVSTLTGLTVNTFYYVRAYATNGVGIAYGNEISFTTDNGPIYHVTCGQTYVYYEVSNAGQIWLDRDLGANRVAQSSTDYLAYGHLFQWGRLSDNHQCINWTSSTTGNPVNGTTTILSSSDEPGNPLFITPTSSPYDWRNPQNDDLWQGLLGTNNPCPPGYRVPTINELGIERSSWNTQNSAGAFNSPLKFPVSSGRNGTTGALDWTGNNGVYWSSSVEGTDTWQLYFNSTSSYTGAGNRCYGGPIRCIKD